LLSFARARLSLEQEYSQRLLKMSDQQLGPLANQQIENQFSSLDQKMPLSLLFGQLMENTKQFASRADSTVQQLQQRFIEVMNGLTLFASKIKKINGKIHYVFLILGLNFKIKNYF